MGEMIELLHVKFTTIGIVLAAPPKGRTSSFRVTPWQADRGGGTRFFPPFLLELTAELLLENRFVLVRVNRFEFGTGSPFTDVVVIVVDVVVDDDDVVVVFMVVFIVAPVIVPEVDIFVANPGLVVMVVLPTDSDIFSVGVSPSSSVDC